MEQNLSLSTSFPGTRPQPHSLGHFQSVLYGDTIIPSLGSAILAHLLIPWLVSLPGDPFINFVYKEDSVSKSWCCPNAVSITMPIVCPWDCADRSASWAPGEQSCQGSHIV